MGRDLLLGHETYTMPGCDSGTLRAALYLAVNRRGSRLRAPKNDHVRDAIADVCRVERHRSAALWAGAALGGPPLPVAARIDRGGDDDFPVAGVHVLPHDGHDDRGIVVIQEDPFLPAGWAGGKLSVAKELALHLTNASPFNHGNVAAALRHP